MFSKLGSKESLKTLCNYEALIDLYKNNQQEAIVINADTINTEQPNYISILETVPLSYFDLKHYSLSKVNKK
jgi:hypothetical protein